MLMCSMFNLKKTMHQNSKIYLMHILFINKLQFLGSLLINLPDITNF